MHFLRLIWEMSRSYSQKSLSQLSSTTHACCCHPDPDPAVFAEGQGLRVIYHPGRLPLTRRATFGLACLLASSGSSGKLVISGMSGLTPYTLSFSVAVAPRDASVWGIRSTHHTRYQTTAFVILVELGLMMESMRGPQSAVRAKLCAAALCYLPSPEVAASKQSQNSSRIRALPKDHSIAEG